MKIIKSIMTVGGFTILSRILGLIRDVILAAVLGAGPTSDAFLIAFKLPNFFRRLFAEGALNAAFVPIFSRIYTSAGIDMARQAAEQVFAVLLCSLTLFVVIMEIMMPDLMYIIAPGFLGNPLQLELTTNLARITFPYILFISVAAFYSGILNSVHKFYAAALSPIILNISIIVALLIIQIQNYSQHMVWILATSVTAGGIIQFLWLHYSCQQTIGHLNLTRPRLTPDVRRLLKAMAPGALGAGVMQINLFIDTILASMLPSGAVTYLYYADRINQLPFSLLGIGISTVLLPVMAKHFEHDRHDKVLKIQAQALIITFALTLPAAIGLAILSKPMLTLLFQHKQFTAYDVQETSKVVMALLLGLPAYVITKILTTSFFAQYDTKTPVKVAVISMIINVSLNIYLMGPFQYVGIALGTSLTAWLNAFILGYRLHKLKLLSIDRALLMKLPKIILTAAIMGYCISIIYNILITILPTCLSYDILKIFITSVFGVLIYLISLMVLQAFKWNELKLLFVKS